MTLLLHGSSWGSSLQAWECTACTVLFFLYSFASLETPTNTTKYKYLGVKRLRFKGPQTAH